MNNYKINVGIIAAGEGLRMRYEGIKIPKPLIEVNGIPLIQRMIDITSRNSAESVSCIINEESTELKKFLQNNISFKPFNLIVKSTPGSFHSLYQISSFLKAPFLLATADSVFTEEEFISFLNYAININSADGVIAVTKFIDDEKPLYADLDENFRVRKFDDKINNPEFVTGGLYLFKKDIQTEINNAVNSGTTRLRNFLRHLIKKDFRFYAYPFSKIIDVDHISDIKKAEAFLNSEDITSR
jgi:NDP-sugar pyrophosphorylase family protein